MKTKEGSLCIEKESLPEFEHSPINAVAGFKKAWEDPKIYDGLVYLPEDRITKLIDRCDRENMMRNP